MKRRIRVYLPAFLALAILFGGYVYANWNGGTEAPAAGPSPTATARPSPQAAATTGATATPTRRPSPPAATATPAARRDLQRDEAAGGHTIERHVGKSDAELRDRLDRERNIPAASTFYDLETAEIAVALALARNRPGIADWEAQRGNRSNLALRATAEEPVGRSHDRDDPAAEDVRGIVVVLAWNTRANDWFVLTSYPEAE